MIKIFSKLNTKGLVFAFIVSFFIWVYLTLNSEYITFVKVPLFVEAPSKFSLAGKIPEYIDVQIIATGWQILNLSIFPKTTSCFVQISEETISPDKKILITKEDFQKGLIFSTSVKVLEIRPTNVVVDIGTIAEKLVPILFNGQINLRENFTIVGQPILQPDAIVIRGRSEILKDIDYWKTEPIIFQDVFQPLKTEIPLLDTLHSLISISRKKVNLIADVELTCEQEIVDVPVKVVGGAIPSMHSLEPQFVSVVVRSGVDRLSQIDLSNLEAKVKYSELLNDTLGIVIPHIKLPYGVELVRIDPPFLYHWRTNKVRG